MRLERASAKAVKYAIMNWHYSKAVPSVSLGFSVFENDVFCGVICYSAGANNNIAKAFGLRQGSVIELVRVAFNGKQSRTSKALSISLKLVKKKAPAAKLIVSYADPMQNHLGVLYQATNWYYIGKSQAQREVINPETGQIMHKRTANAKYGTIKGLQKSEVLWKHKYIYPIDKSLIPMCKELAKPYPKK